MTVLLTNCQAYAGPGVVEVFERAGSSIACHDPSFADRTLAQSFESSHRGAVALSAQQPSDIADELEQRGIELTAVVHNDVLSNTPTPVDLVAMEDFQRAFDALFLFPVALTQALLPRLRGRGGAALVFVTSARYLKPEPGYSVATSIRAATTNFALALAREVAADGIQVNVVAPNFLMSETYYPSATYVDSAEGREFIQAQVPMGRLGRAEEIGELIHFLASGKAGFVTGQTIHFTGGWPA